jgi:DNA sulfur modification protein DndC
MIIDLKNKINFIEAEIIDQYLNDASSRPWILGFSGGKDSTMMLQLVWYALLKIKPEQRTRHVYLVCNDTLVENPKIVQFIQHILAKINNAALAQGMPITVHETLPKLEETFWVNLIGRGYPAPNNIFRWCTERLKIDPTTNFILEKISQSGEVIILLGTRIEESSNRARSIKKYQRSGERLRKHVLNNAYVYGPITDITTEEVWQYLSSVPAPWGGNHYRLITLYRNASGGDCPLVIDDSTPSCGTSRFGCWVCTVVNKDKSMDALIDNGEDWMLPLSELRNYLIETRDGAEKYRSKIGRDGKEKPEGKFGPYLPEVRYEILKRLLEAQAEIQLTEPIIQLISQQELVAIQVLWFRDGLFQYRVSELYNQVYQRSINMASMSKLLRNQKQEEEVLMRACENKIEDYHLIRDLLDLERNKVLLLKKRGLIEDIRARIDKQLKTISQSN